MEINNKGQGFSYTYSAKEQEEIKRIRKKYMPPEEDKMEQLRRLDRRVTERAQVISLIFGIIGALVLGVGMCCVMVWGGGWFVPGIIMGVVGMIITALAYPAYVYIASRERARVSDEILRLTDELMR